MSSLNNLLLGILIISSIVLVNTLTYKTTSIATENIKVVLKVEREKYYPEVPIELPVLTYN
jgi:hypothetical protein